MKDDKLTRTLPSHLAMLLAPEILRHHEENFCARIQTACNAVASLLLLPVIVVHPFSGLFILPYLAGLAIEVATDPTKEYLEGEADHVALRLADRAGFDVTDTLIYWATSFERNVDTYNTIVKRHGGENIPVNVGLAHSMVS